MRSDVWCDSRECDGVFKVTKTGPQKVIKRQLHPLVSYFGHFYTILIKVCFN